MIKPLQHNRFDCCNRLFRFLQYMKKIIDDIRKVYPISPATAEELVGHLEPCMFPRRSPLISMNVFNRAAYFIKEGITRSYWIKGGEEITTSFSTSGIVFSMDEFYYGRLSEEYVEALTDVKAVRIPLTDLEHLFRTNIELANWGRIIHQNEYRRIHRSHMERLALPAAERYEAFRKQFPEICNNVNLQYIASYLGITAPTLSRLRSRKQQ